MQSIDITLPSGVPQIDLNIRNHRSSFFMFYLIHTPTGQRVSITADLSSFVNAAARDFNDVLTSASAA